MRRRAFLKALGAGFAGAVAGGLGYFAPSEPWDILGIPESFSLSPPEQLVHPALSARIVDMARAFALKEDELFFEARPH